MEVEDGFYILMYFFKASVYQCESQWSRLQENFYSHIVICFRGFFFLIYGTFIVYCTFTLKFISQIYTLLCKVSIFNLSDDITSHAPGELCFISRL